MQALTCSTLPSPARPREATGGIPGYRLVRELARGGMGRVVIAEDLTLRRPVAIKTLLVIGTDAVDSIVVRQDAGRISVNGAKILSEHAVADIERHDHINAFRLHLFQARAHLRAGECERRET